MSVPASATAQWILKRILTSTLFTIIKRQLQAFQTSDGQYHTFQMETVRNPYDVNRAMSEME